VDFEDKILPEEHTAFIFKISSLKIEAVRTLNPYNY
jgi:hypothetical protein